MLVRITSENLLSNQNLELFENNTPIGWQAFLSGSASKNEWVLSDSQTLSYPADIEFVGKTSTFFDNVNIRKGARVKVIQIDPYGVNASGVYRNIPTVNNTLASSYRDFIDVDATQQETQDRYVVVNANSQVAIESFSTAMRIETNMLFTNNYAANNNRSLRVIRTATGREIGTTGIYNPLSTQFSFVACEDEVNNLNTFFLTCIKYGAGYTVEAFITPESATFWGNFLWGNNKWGGFNPAGEWVKVFTVNSSSFSHNRGSATGEITISAVLQKSEVNNVI